MRIARETELRTGDAVFSPTYGMYTVIDMGPGDEVDMHTLVVFASKTGEIFEYPVLRDRKDEYHFVYDGILLRRTDDE